MTPDGVVPTNRTFRITGEVCAANGSSITARIPRASVGDLCWIHTRNNRSIQAQIVGFQAHTFSLAPLADASGIYPGAIVETFGESFTVPVGDGLLGRVISALGLPLDRPTDPIQGCEQRSVYARPPSASDRPIINTPLITGIRSIDGFCTIGLGQRIGVFASAGVGKSTLLGMLARRAHIDRIVVALVGERGREVREFIEQTLGAEGLQRSVIVVATSDEPSLVRQMAPYTATTVAEYFRDKGQNVLLIVDSLTRFARALRETSLSAGELPVRHGYTTSVYTELPKLLERAGTNGKGSLTALYTVLTNEEDDIDPLADEVKSLLDGHLVLKKSLASRGIFPALDITESVSRLFTRFHSTDYLSKARTVMSAMNRLIRERDIALIGGSPDDQLSKIISMETELFSVVQQRFAEDFSLEQTRSSIENLALSLA